MNKIIKLVLFNLVIISGAYSLEDGGGTNASIGTVNINGEIYNQLSIKPEIPIGKLGIGLDIYFYFNENGIYWENWDFKNSNSIYRTIVDKIYYLRWGEPGDDIYILAGALPSVTLGHGMLINNYSNLMEYPQIRQIGLNVQAKLNGFNFEFVHSNFKVSYPGIIGFRTSYSIIPQKLSVGTSFVTDLNQYAGLKDIDGDTYPDYYDLYPNDPNKHDNKDSLKNIYDTWDGDYLGQGIAGFDAWYNSQGYEDVSFSDMKKDPVSGMAFDITYNMSENMTIFSQYAKLYGASINNEDFSNGNDSLLGWGFVPVGIKAKIGPLDVLTEYRINSRRFIFSYWDRAYDINRVSIVTDDDGDKHLLTKESQLYQFGSLKGFFMQTSLSIMEIIKLGVGYQNMVGEKWDDELKDYKLNEKNQTFLSTVSLDNSIIPKLGKADAFYQQSNIPNPFKFNPNTSTIWGYDIGIELSNTVMLLYKNRTSYIEDSEYPDSFLPIKNIQIETQFTF